MSFDSEYHRALRASGSVGTSTSPEEEKRRLREIVWVALRTYGDGARYVDGEKRFVWAPTIGMPASNSETRFISLDELDRTQLREAAKRVANLPVSAPAYITQPSPEKDFLRKKVTIYRQREMGMGYNRIEATSFFHQLIPYAQYPQAHQVIFTPKGARKPREYMDTYRPTTIVIEGWGHPEPEGIMAGAVGGHSRLSMDPTWNKNFNRMIDSYIKEKKAKVIIDVRSKT